jgi:ubiquinone/menaquinone biosynthesis C-methylase UbiE
MADRAGEFAAFEFEGWQRVAGQYAEAFGPLTAQATDALLDAVGAGPLVRLLDVATGPGMVAARAAERGAVVTAIDFSPAMILDARRRHGATADIVFEEGDACALTYPDANFDAVVMNFGMLHLAEPDRAISEARRVLRPGGHYAFTVWAEPSAAVGFGMVLNAVERFGTTEVPLPEGPAFFRFASPAESRRALEAAGFGDVQSHQLPLVWHVTSADAVVDALLNAGVRTSALLRAQTPESLEAIRLVVRQEVRRYGKGGSFNIPMPAVLTSATAS